MSGRIITYRTKHFEFRIPIDDWDKNKIPLPEGAGAPFIAPSDVEAVLVEPFDYDLTHETDGRINPRSPILVYGEDWVGKKIRHFPWCKELFEFLDWLKKNTEHGWYIFTSWVPFYHAVRSSLAHKQGIHPSRVTDREVVIAFRKGYNLEPSGYVYGGELRLVGKDGSLWSASEESAIYAFTLWFTSGYVDPTDYVYRHYAQSVRCVAESGSFPNS